MTASGLQFTLRWFRGKVTSTKLAFPQLCDYLKIKISFLKVLAPTIKELLNPDSCSDLVHIYNGRWEPNVDTGLIRRKSLLCELLYSMKLETTI